MEIRRVINLGHYLQVLLECPGLGGAAHVHPEGRRADRRRARPGAAGAGARVPRRGDGGNRRTDAAVGRPRPTLGEPPSSFFDTTHPLGSAVNILGSLEHVFTLDADGEAWAAPTLAAPGTSWNAAQALVVFLEVDGRRRQALVVAGGADPTEYLRCLGRLTRGPHALRFHLDPRSLVPPTGGVELLNLRTGAVADTDPIAKIWASAPILHYREDAGVAEGTATDTPLLLFYRAAAPSSTGSPARGARVPRHLFPRGRRHGPHGALGQMGSHDGHRADLSHRVRRSRRILGQVYQGRDHRALSVPRTRAGARTRYCR